MARQSVADKLGVIQQSLTNIKTAITNKGVYPSGNITTYADAIDEINGVHTDYKINDVNFFDCDGSIVYSCTANEALHMSSLPALPDRTEEGLVCDGWNYTLQDIIDTVNEQGQCDVGCTYNTHDGKTRMVINITEETKHVVLGYCQSIKNGVTVDWGDGSPKETSAIYGTSFRVNLAHTYETTGRYTVTFEVVLGNIYFRRGGSWSYIIYDGTESIIARKYNATIEEVHFGNNVEFLALDYCVNLTGVTYPNTVRNIDRQAFERTSIPALIFPKGITTTPIQCAYNTKLLTAVSVPRSVTTLSSYAFTNMYMERLVIPFTVTNIADRLVSGCINLKRLVLPPNVTINLNNAFYNCNQLQEIVNQPTTSSITGSYVIFQNCNLLQTPTWIDGINTPTPTASLFADCWYLKSMTIPEGVTALGASTFSYCIALESVTLPSTLTTIGGTCFQYCSKLQEIVIPPTVTSIAASTFAYMSSIRVIDFSSFTKVPTLASTNAFSGTLSIATSQFDPKIVVPKALFTQWRSATNWLTYKDFIWWRKEDGGYSQATEDYTYENGNILPTVLQEVEWISPNNTSAYINTLLSPFINETTEIEAVVNFTAKSSARQLIGGDYGRYFGLSTDGYYEIGTAYKTNIPAVNVWNKLNLICEYNKTTFKVNDEIVKINLNPTPQNTRISIFTIGTTSAGVTATSSAKLAQCGYFKITVSGEVKRNFIPCYHKTTNAIGMFDTITETFFVNANTAGAFTKGNDGNHKTM